MSDLAALQVRLDLQSAAFEKGMKQATRSMDRMGRNTRKTNGILGGFDRQLRNAGRGLAIMGASLLSAFSVRAVKNAIETADAIGKISTAVGLGSTDFQRYSFAAERGGIATKQFGSNMTAFVKRVGELKNGMGPLVSGLKGWNDGLIESLKNSTSQKDAFRLIAEAVKNSGSATERAAIANAAFSRSGVAMVNMLADGVEGMKQLGDQAEQLGAVLDATLIEKAQVINDRWDSLITSLKTKMQSLVLTFADTLSKLTGRYNDLAEAEERIKEINNELVEQHGRLATSNMITAIGYRRNIEILKQERRVIEENIEPLKRLAEIRERNAAAAGAGSGPGGSGGKGGGIVTIDITAVNEANTMLKRYEKAVISADLATKLIGDKVKILHRLMLDGAISTDRYRAELEKFSVEAGTNAPAALNAMAVAAGNLAAGAITDMVDAFIEGSRSFTDLVANFLKGIAKMIIQQTIFNAIAGSSFGSFFGFGARALGGPVQSGKTYLVGERGPELFTPNGSGRITANDRLNGGNTTINIINNSKADIQTSETKSANGETSIEVMISDAVKQEIKRGSFDSVNRSSYGLQRVGY